MTPDQDPRHQRVLRQWAAKIVADLPPSDADSRQVLAYANQLLDNYLGADADRREATERHAAMN